ncbi:hypothetical protein VNI00_018611 [Paramarasmius palmivorus]|uniref:Uncharacterized protein n=1 Tax=Paramarasmius palmivorus TaxID=297713 RepID=A0AAW0AVF7_9AGAR
MARLKAANKSESQHVLIMAQNAYHAAAQKADSVARSVNALERKEAEYKALRRRNKEWHHEYNVVVAQLAAERSSLEREQEKVERCLRALEKAEEISAAAEKLAKPNESIDTKNVDVTPANGSTSAAEAERMNVSSELSELSSDGYGKKDTAGKRPQRVRPTRGPKPAQVSAKNTKTTVRKGNRKTRKGRAGNSAHPAVDEAPEPSTSETPVTSEINTHGNEATVHEGVQAATATHGDISNSIANTDLVETALAKDVAASSTDPEGKNALEAADTIDSIAKPQDRGSSDINGDISTSISITNLTETALAENIAASSADPEDKNALEAADSVDLVAKPDHSIPDIEQAAQDAMTEHNHQPSTTMSDAPAVDNAPSIIEGPGGGISLATGAVQESGGSEDKGTHPDRGDTVEGAPSHGRISITESTISSLTPSNIETSTASMGLEVRDDLSNGMNGAAASRRVADENQSMDQNVSFKQRMNNALMNSVQSILDNSPPSTQYRPPNLRSSINANAGSGENVPFGGTDTGPDSHQPTVLLSEPINDRQAVPTQSDPATCTSSHTVEVQRVIPGLTELQEKLSRIPLGPEDGSADCPLQPFTVPPITHDIPGVSGNELFESVINGLFHRVFMGRSSLELAGAIRSGRQGVAGFCDFVIYFSAVGVHRSVFEPRIEKLSEAVDIAFPIEHAGHISKQHGDTSSGYTLEPPKDVLCETPRGDTATLQSHVKKGAEVNEKDPEVNEKDPEVNEKDRATLTLGLDGDNHQVKHESPPSMRLLNEVDTNGTFFKRLADSIASAEVTVSRSKVKKVETKRERLERLVAAAAARKERAAMKALSASAQKKRKTGTSTKVPVAVNTKSAHAGAPSASVEKHSGKRKHEEVTNADDDEYLPDMDEEEDYADDEHLHESYKQKANETVEQHFSRMSDLATTAVENFLENPRDPRKQQIPFGIRNWIRDNSNNCPIAGTTCVELSIHILTTKYGLIKCDYHHWSDKSTLKNDHTTELKPKSERIGLFGQLVTGVPKQPILLKRDTGKSPELGYCHCGCRVKDAVSGLFIYKTQKVYSETHQLDEGFNDLHMDPRNRNVLIRALEENTGLKMYERFSHVLSTDGLLRYVEVKEEEREALRRERLVGKRSVD